MKKLLLIRMETLWFAETKETRVARKPKSRFAEMPNARFTKSTRFIKMEKNWFMGTTSLLRCLLLAVWICLGGMGSPVAAQLTLPVYPDSLFSTYYHQRHSLFQSLPRSTGDIIFIGNSITDGGEWQELFDDPAVKNRGISGDISAGVINRIQEVTVRKPNRVFLMIGTNDLARDISPDNVLKNIIWIADYIRQETPSTKLFIQSVLPVNDVFGKFSGHTGRGAEIRELNSQLQYAAAAHRFTYLDLYASFCNDQGKLDERFTNDGLHLTGEGYLLWQHLVFAQVYGLQDKPSLLPQPKKLDWQKGSFPLYDCRSILVTQKELEPEAEKLQAMLASFGYEVAVQATVPATVKYIELRLDGNGSLSAPESAELSGPVASSYAADHTDPGYPAVPARQAGPKGSGQESGEAYLLTVSEDRILITGKTPHAIFNGLQTLQQLMRDGYRVAACQISDWPSFSWRGFMIDVGRNYASMDMLKEQIEVMSRYKFNVFHFHATEDIAWRIAIRQYPQLTAPENMLRDKGLYYSQQEIQELIDYCRERHIQFVPEIDMPGHSAAFERAMGVDMQSDTGERYVRKILREFLETYDVPYVHIGADEVEIVNREFVPRMTEYIESFGRRVIGWQPGGNFTDNTIRQLWRGGEETHIPGKHIRSIDSRHLYLNHMDPLEAVVTLYNRRIGGVTKEDSAVWGGTICLWHDRAVANEDDVLKMNPVYAGMLSFAERSWAGGGQPGWVANISDGDEKGFGAFEARLLDHRRLYFAEKPFPYTRQSHLRWKLYGPYDNGGELDRKFTPERRHANWATSFVKEISGGTVVLRHWWAPQIKGAIDQPAENTTWYATTRIWADEAGEKQFWIGFNNLSRSPATDSPPAGAWDNKSSEVWVNGNRISPPHWKRPGQKGNSEIPLSDEGYEYRPPTPIYLQAGWNQVLIKAPVGSFKGPDRQNPVKWMFTFVQLED